MHLRAFLRSIFLLPVAALFEVSAQEVPITPKVKKMEIDGWLLQLPNEWRSHPLSKSNAPAFCSLDGKKSCFIRVQSLPLENQPSPIDIALESRHLFQQSAESDTKFTWRVMRETIASLKIGVVQNLDLFDAGNKVRYTQTTSIAYKSIAMLILHDYDCESYADSVAFFAPIIESLYPA